MKYTREHILAELHERWVTLEPDLLAAAEDLAAGDREVARALEECRLLSRLNSERILGQPETSDAAFLTAVRSRIEREVSPRAARGVFGTVRVATVSTVVGVFLMAVLLGQGVWTGTGSLGLRQLTDADYAHMIDPVAVMDMDGLASVSASPESLAVYLDIPELAEAWRFDGANDVPMTDALLSLDQQSLEEVINKLEATEFF
ncbi:hypothetical protein KJ815_06415 [bacterium]|nr:hypothetical protein [bacterium]